MNPLSLFLRSNSACGGHRLLSHWHLCVISSVLIVTTDAHLYIIAAAYLEYIQHWKPRTVSAPFSLLPVPCLRRRLHH